MKLRSKFVKVSIVLCVLGSLAIVSSVWNARQPEGEESSSMGIFLTRPAFAQGAEFSFLDQEAGIAAYTNLAQNIDLSKIRPFLRTVEKETDTYIIGSIAVPKYEGYPREDVHCFAHKDGWVVTYYRNVEPTAKIISWKDWGGTITGTKLDMALASAVNALGKALPYVRYYHFKYPDAAKLMIIVKDTTSEVFRIMVPSSFTFYERSWSNGHRDRANGHGASIDIWTGQWTDIAATDSANGAYSASGSIDPTQLSPDVFHSFRVTWGYGAIVLLYQES